MEVVGGVAAPAEPDAGLEMLRCGAWWAFGLFVVAVGADGGVVGVEDEVVVAVPLGLEADVAGFDEVEGDEGGGAAGGCGGGALGDILGMETSRFWGRMMVVLVGRSVDGGEG